MFDVLITGENRKTVLSMPYFTVMAEDEHEAQEPHQRCDNGCAKLG